MISGVGGLGHMAIQYARAMGLRVAAVDVDDRKLDLAHLQEALAFAGEGLRFMPPNRYYANAGEVVTDLSSASVLGRQVLEDAISFFYLSEARLTSMVSKP